MLGRQTDTTTNWAGSSGQEIPELTCLRGGGPPEGTPSRCIEDLLPPVPTAAGLSGGHGCGLDTGCSGTGKRWASRSKQAVLHSLPPDKRSRFGPLLLAQRDFRAGGFYERLESSSQRLNPMDRGAWRATVPGAQESDTTERLNHHRPEADPGTGLLWQGAPGLADHAIEAEKQQEICHLEGFPGLVTQGPPPPHWLGFLTRRRGCNKPTRLKGNFCSFARYTDPAEDSCVAASLQRTTCWDRGRPAGTEAAVPST